LTTKPALAIQIGIVGAKICRFVAETDTPVIVFDLSAFKKQLTTWILHESESFICKALKGATIRQRSVADCKPLITKAL
jgi:hypothetical protein